MNVCCPICGGSEFGSYRGRANERCSSCGAKERTRMHHLLLSRLVEIKTGLPFFHIAPERPIAQKLISMYWEDYRPVDLFPEFYTSPVKVSEMDLTKDLKSMPDNSVAGFFHSHVLEHIRAPLPEIFSEMNRVIAPGGLHFFCVPISAETYEEDYSEELTDKDRLKRFGQEDHVRVFGRTDFEKMFLGPSFPGFTRIHLDLLISEYEAVRAGIRLPNLRRRGPPQTFIFLKNS